MGLCGVMWGYVGLCGVRFPRVFVLKSVGVGYMYFAMQITNSICHELHETMWDTLCVERADKLGAGIEKLGVGVGLASQNGSCQKWSESA